jgi:hypothetical protein
MGDNTGYPAKSRTTALDRTMPGRHRTAEVDRTTPGGRGGAKSDTKGIHKPKKGALRRGRRS